MNTDISAVSRFLMNSQITYLSRLCNMSATFEHGNIFSFLFSNRIFNIPFSLSCVNETENRES